MKKNYIKECKIQECDIQECDIQECEIQQYEIQKYEFLKEKTKLLAHKYSFGYQFINYIDNCGFEVTFNDKIISIESKELINKILLIIDDNTLNILQKIEDFKKYSNIGDIYNLWKIIYIKCFNPILIIGGGVSGLTIASGIKDGNFMILEARERIGGRVYTNDKNLDMGAAWIHGINDNPLNKFINMDNLIPVASCNPWMHSENTQIKYLNKTCNITEDIRQKLASQWNSIATKIGNIHDKTILEGFDEIKEEILNNNDGQNNDKNLDLFSFLYMIEVWCGGSIKNISTSFLNEPNYTKALFGDYGGSHCLFKNGAKTLIESIINSFENKSDFYQKIRYNQIVTKIIYNDYYVEVHTNEGKIYNCNKLCITVPPGPLKDITFSPPLTHERITSLNKIKMSSYKKIQLEFDNVFWSNIDSPMFLTYNTNINGETYYLKNEDSNESLFPYILWNNYKYSKNKGSILFNFSTSLNIELIS
jgi:hypothetical protein